MLFRKKSVLPYGVLYTHFCLPLEAFIWNAVAGALWERGDLGNGSPRSTSGVPGQSVSAESRGEAVISLNDKNSSIY